MPTLKNVLPKYRKHRESVQAVVTICGHDHYLGRYGSEGSHALYDKLTAEWIAQGRPRVLVSRQTGICVNELILAYCQHVAAYYVKAGEPTNEQTCIRTALKPVRKLYGTRGSSTNCDHNSCSWSWPDLRAHFEPSRRTAEPTDGPCESVDDPHRLARGFLAVSGSDAPIVFWCGEWYTYSGAAYQKYSPEELRAELIRFIKSEFDREGRELSAADPGSNVVTRRVTTALITNVLRVLESEAILPSLTTAPLWLHGEQNPPANEIVAVQNGLLRLPRRVGDAPELLPATHEISTLNALAYDFRPDAECPHWVQFLDSLWPDDSASIDTLQQIFGYCLVPDTSQQKMFLVIGPPRSGKDRQINN
jgi:hypothetical protein